MTRLKRCSHLESPGSVGNRATRAVTTRSCSTSRDERRPNLHRELFRLEGALARPSIDASDPEPADWILNLERQLPWPNSGPNVCEMSLEVEREEDREIPRNSHG